MFENSLLQNVCYNLRGIWAFKSNIVKTAGVTTGAFYCYYGSKEELFAALVNPAYEYMMERYRQAHEYFESLPMEKQPEQIGTPAPKIDKRLEHIITLPMGFMDGIGSRKIRKIVYESSSATETYLAHQLPDKANVLATPVGLLMLLLVFDWRLGLLSLLLIVAAFVIMSVMTRNTTISLNI